MSLLGNLFGKKDQEKKPAVKYGVPREKMAEFQILCAMGANTAKNFLDLTEDEKSRMLAAFWARWGDFVQIDKIREERKKEK